MTPPPTLPEIERLAMASQAPAVCPLDRANLRALIRYVRALEAELARFRAEADQGGDWRRMVL